MKCEHWVQIREFVLNYPVKPRCLWILVYGASLGGGQWSGAGFRVDDAAIVRQSGGGQCRHGVSRSTTVISNKRLGCCHVHHNSSLWRLVNAASTHWRHAVSRMIGLPHAEENTLWVKKTGPFLFEHNFRKYCPILIILSLLQTEIIYQQTCNWIAHFIYSLLLHYLENATAYTSSQKLLNKSQMHAVISLLLQRRKFWWYLWLTVSMLLRDVIVTSYCCQRYAECLVTTLFQHDSTPAHRAAQLLLRYVKKRQTFLRLTCGLPTAQISVLLTTRS